MIRASDPVIWEKALVQGELEISGFQLIRRFVLEFFDKQSLKRTKPSQLALTALRVLARLPSPEKSRLRFLLTRFLPFNPLKENPCSIEVFIFTSAKDLSILPLSIVGASDSHEGAISKITIVAPDSERVEIELVIEKLELIGIGLRYISDEVLLSDFAISSIEFVRGNIKMEIVKVLAGLTATEPCVLLIDGDTVLLRKRNWATTNQYLLMVAQEYSSTHINYDKLVIHNYEQQGLGFVTHHQLIKREVLKKLVESFGGVQVMADSFNNAASKYYYRGEQIFPSEWQLIGDFQYGTEHQNVVLANFSNLGMSRNKLDWMFDSMTELGEIESRLRWLRTEAAELGSISFHGYKSDS